MQNLLTVGFCQKKENEINTFLGRKNSDTDTFKSKQNQYPTMSDFWDLQYSRLQRAYPSTLKVSGELRLTLLQRWSSRMQEDESQTSEANLAHKEVRRNGAEQLGREQMKTKCNDTHLYKSYDALASLMPI